MTEFASQTVVVTGASRGLGRAIALAFANAAAHVIIGYRRREQEAQETLREVCAVGSGELLQLDVRQPASVQTAFESISRAHGRIDILVNNAGVAHDAPTAMLDVDAWRDVIAVNLDGAFLCTKAALPLMMRQRSGVVINIASVAAHKAGTAGANYAASKGGVLAFTNALAAEVAPRGIRVNAVVPGFINAGMVQCIERTHIQRVVDAIPMGRMGAAEDVARAVLFLASSNAGYITGCALPVDGGLSL